MILPVYLLHKSHLDSVLALGDALDSLHMDDPALQDAVEFE